MKTKEIKTLQDVFDQSQVIMNAFVSGKLSKEGAGLAMTEVTSEFTKVELDRMKDDMMGIVEKNFKNLAK